MVEFHAIIKTGICKCGCSWEDHHLGFIMNEDALEQMREENPNHPPYYPQECERYGWNEQGGLKYNEETEKYEDHCQQYEE